MLKVEVLKRLGEFTLRAAFSVPTPGVLALFGRSGCGKSTLLNILSGLLKSDQGRVELDGEPLEDTAGGISVRAEYRRIGYVFQDARLFPHLDVLGNLHYGLNRTPVASPTIAFDQVIELLGLARLLRRRPRDLSGGERQRVALGRALLSQPRLLLLDEPLASVDIARRDDVLPYLEALRDHLSIPMVYVSHQFDEVLRLATHVVVMDAGSVLAQGSLQEVSLLPALRAVAGPESVGAVLEGTVIRADLPGVVDIQVGRGVLTVSVREVPRGVRVRVQLLARDVILATHPPQGLSVRNELPGKIAELTDDEDAVLVKVDIGGPLVLARVTQAAVQSLALRPGLPVWVLVKAVSTRGHAFRL